MGNNQRQPGRCSGGDRLMPAGGLPTAGETCCAHTSAKATVVGTRLTAKERLAGWAVRWGIGRMNYRIAPGLYAVGNPDQEAMVLVTANYKLSFDALRKELDNLDAWILVLDTRGINVWCAAGKGTFGTAELVGRIQSTGLHGMVSHRKLILPQLGATGVAAHAVQQQTGFRVVYGPVRARDIKAFLAAGMKATPAMRRVTFKLAERLAVVPLELVTALKYFLIIYLAWALWSFIGGETAPSRLLGQGVPLLGALLVGTVLVPVLLPWIPCRSFALKGWLAGTVWALGVSLTQKAGLGSLAVNMLLLPAISAFLALNFTGATTFTSQTGVNKEIRLFARPIAISALLGVAVMVGRMIW